MYQRFLVLIGMVIPIGVLSHRRHLESVYEVNDDWIQNWNSESVEMPVQVCPVHRLTEEDKLPHLNNRIH